MKYFFTALIPIVAIATVVILAKRVASHPFLCKHCSKTFPVLWWKVLVTEHSENEYMLLCPHCKTKDWCSKQPLI